jgi:hypothetical protein
VDSFTADNARNPKKDFRPSRKIPEISFDFDAPGYNFHAIGFSSTAPAGGFIRNQYACPGIPCYASRDDTLDHRPRFVDRGGFLRADPLLGAGA